MTKKVAMYANIFETSIGQTIPYMTFAQEFGEVILVHAESNLPRIIKECDILIVPGGMDISTLRYHQSPGFHTRYANQHYEYLDDRLLTPWLVTGKPIIAICRGMQTLNVAMGGTLHRHVKNHNIEVKEGRSALTDEMYTEFENHRIVKINTFHHQAVARVAAGFKVIGWSGTYVGCPSYNSEYILYEHMYEAVKGKKEPEKSKKRYACIPELMVHTERPYIAFQYHPEELMDSFSLSLAKNVIENTNLPLYADGKQTTQKEETVTSNDGDFCEC